MNIQRKFGKTAKLLWKDRKRFMGMPLSFTRYYLIEDPTWVKMFVEVGFTYSSIEEVNLYRICDVGFHQSLFGKIFNTGTITLKSSDETKPTLVLVNVKDPYTVRDLIADLVEREKQVHGVRATEFHTHNG